MTQPQVVQPDLFSFQGRAAPTAKPRGRLPTAPPLRSIPTTAGEPTIALERCGTTHLDGLALPR